MQENRRQIHRIRLTIPSVPVIIHHSLEDSSVLEDHRIRRIDHLESDLDAAAATLALAATVHPIQIPASIHKGSYRNILIDELIHRIADAAAVRGQVAHLMGSEGRRREGGGGQHTPIDVSGLRSGGAGRAAPGEVVPVAAAGEVRGGRVEVAVLQEIGAGEWPHHLLGNTGDDHAGPVVAVGDDEGLAVVGDCPTVQTRPLNGRSSGSRGGRHPGLPHGLSVFSSEPEDLHVAAACTKAVVGDHGAHDLLRIAVQAAESVAAFICP